MTQLDFQLPTDQLQLGKLYFKIVDFKAAISHLNKAMQEAEGAKDWQTCCRYLPLLLRIHAERLDFNAVYQLKARLRTWGQDLQAHSTTCYALGISSSYEGQIAQASAHFHQAQSLAQSPHERVQANFGLATVAFQKKDFVGCLAQLESLSQTLCSTLLIDFKLAAGLLAAICERELGRVPEAFRRLIPLQEICRVEQNLYMSLNVLFCLATLHQVSGEFARAREHFVMVQSLLAPEDLKHLAQQVHERLQKLDTQKSPRATFQLIENSTTQLLTPDGRSLAFGNQFVLVALFKMLAGAPGVSLSKEEIVRRLWKEDYHPLHHDNKLYVTIRRLRKMIEPDVKSSSYILTHQNGYMFNPEAHVQMRA